MRLIGRRSTLTAIVMALLLSVPVVWGEQGLPQFETDQDADRWLREHSATYAWMAEGMDRRGGYDIAATAEYSGGVAYTHQGRGFIGLNDALTGGHRVSVLIFEMTNLHQDDRHLEVARRVRTGELNDPVEFSLLREMIEHDGLRLHWSVLKELKGSLGTIPPEMFTWVAYAERFAEYQPPYAYDYIKAQMASGHTDHYMRLFKVHRAEYTNSLAAAGEVDRQNSDPVQATTPEDAQKMLPATGD